MRNYKDKDIREWPQSWAGFKEDIAYGRELLKLFIPFINDLKTRGRTTAWVNRHIDNMWLLGGYVIRHINIHKEDRNQLPCLLLTHFIDSIDGPRINDISGKEQNLFNKTCVLFYRHLVENTLSKLGGSGRTGFLIT